MRDRRMLEHTAEPRSDETAYHIFYSCPHSVDHARSAKVGALQLAPTFGSACGEAPVQLVRLRPLKRCVGLVAEECECCR